MISRHYIVAFLLMAVLLGCSGEPELTKNERDQQGLQGSVKSYQESLCENVRSELCKYKITHFDEDGFLTLEEFYDENSNLTTAINFTRNELNYIVKRETVNGKGDEITHSNYTYKNGLITEELTIDGDAIFRKVLEYDTNDSLSKAQLFTNEELFAVYTYEYDPKEDTKIETIENFNTNGLIVNTVIADNEGRMSESTVEMYFDKNHTQLADAVYRHKVYYNDNGQVTERVSVQGNNPENYTRYEYEYDEHGNWLTRTSFLDDILIGRTFREYEYY